MLCNNHFINLFELTEDVRAFKKDVEDALNYISKIRNRSKDIELIRQHLKLLLEENFEDIFPKSDLPVPDEDEDVRGHRKRLRSPDTDSVDEISMKKSTRVVKKEGDDKPLAVTSTVVVKMAYNEKVRKISTCINHLLYCSRDLYLSAILPLMTVFLVYAKYSLEAEMSIEKLAL